MVHIRDYFVHLNKKVFVLSTCFIAIFIFLNYYLKLNNAIFNLPEGWQYVSWYLVFLVAYAFPYLTGGLATRAFLFKKDFVILFLIAPAIFSWKMVFDPHFHLSSNRLQNVYWNQVVYWPFKLMIVALVLFFLWKLTGEQQSFYGTGRKNFSFKPYALMLVMMIPLVASASTQPDFLAVYPKLKTISFLKADHTAWYKILYELSYGSDFVSIELFFRGFLVMAFSRWIGKDAILPMACFYCTIHFGKPLGECISSYFGGLILGVVTYHTRSIWGGLMVHLGIAWMMELGGYLGNKVL